MAPLLDLAGLVFKAHTNGIFIAALSSPSVCITRHAYDRSSLISFITYATRALLGLAFMFFST